MLHFATDPTSLEGTIPTEIGMIASLHRLDLSKCEFDDDGGTNKLLANNAMLAESIFVLLHLNNNQLQCPFTSTDNNDITGKIPSEIGTLASLVFLDLGEYKSQCDTFLPRCFLSNQCEI